MKNSVSMKTFRPVPTSQLSSRYSFKLNCLKTINHVYYFQVVTGGHYDIDFELTAPNKEVLYREVKKQYDSFSKKADMSGVYTACFSNEFSTFSHKLIYVDWQVGSEDPLPGLGEHLTAMTQVNRINDKKFRNHHVHC